MRGQPPGAAGLAGPVSLPPPQGQEQLCRHWEARPPRSWTCTARSPLPQALGWAPVSIAGQKPPAGRRPPWSCRGASVGESQDPASTRPRTPWRELFPQEPDASPPGGTRVRRGGALSFHGGQNELSLGRLPAQDFLERTRWAAPCAPRTLEVGTVHGRPLCCLGPRALPAPVNCSPRSGRGKRRLQSRPPWPWASRRPPRPRDWVIAEARGRRAGASRGPF